MRKPSIRFEDILDDCVTAIQERGKTVAECLSHYPAQREELEPLLRLTVRLQPAGTLKAPPEFHRVSTIRVHNLVTAQSHPVQRAVTKPGPLRHIQQRLRAILQTRRRLPATVTINIVLAVWLVVGAGTVYASTNALPGDALYPVKKAVETTQLAVSLNDATDARLHLTFATRRLDEVAGLLTEDRPQSVTLALAGYETQIESVLAFFGEDSDLPPDEQTSLADLLVTAQAHHEAQFTALFDQVPEDTRRTIELALIASRGARDRALQVLGAQPGEPKDLPEPPTVVPTVLPTASPQPPTETPTPTPAPTRRPAPTSSPEPPTPTWPRPWPTPPPDWTPPPGWPTPPPDWTPPADWTPRPDWPTPPPDWTPPAWPTPPPGWTPPARVTIPPWPTPPNW